MNIPEDDKQRVYTFGIEQRRSFVLIDLSADRLSDYARPANPSPRPAQRVSKAFKRALSYLLRTSAK